jgi:hypothetical protein
MVSLGSLEILFLFVVMVLIFFIVGLLSIAPGARQLLGGYRISLETGLLIPSDKRALSECGIGGEMCQNITVCAGFL